MADSKRIKLEKLEYDTIEIDEDLKDIIDNLAEAEDTDDCANEISEILERMDNGELEDNEDNADIREIQYRGVVEKANEEVHKVKKKHIVLEKFVQFGIILFIVVATIAVLWNTIFSGYRLNKIIQNSMEPTLMDGDLLIMENVTMDEIEVGNIITYRSTLEGNTIDITHRVVGKYELIVNDSGITNSEVTEELRMQGYVGAKVLKTAGDNNEKPDDGWVTEDKIVGRIVYDLGPQSRILVALVLAIVILSNIINILITILSNSRNKEKSSPSV